MWKGSVCFFALLVGACFVDSAKAREVGFCSSCSSQASFEAYAEGLTNSKPPGTYEYYVANYDTEVVYDVTVTKIYEAELQWTHYIASGSPASQSTVNAFKSVKDVMEKDEHIVVVPSNNTSPALGSFSGYETQQVFALISQQTWMITLASNSVWSLAVKAALGQYPTVVFVFRNGDVAKFKVNLPGQPSACCSYVQGSARDSDGNFINDSGLGGIGQSDGSTYVQSGPPMNPNEYKAYVDGEGWYFCYLDENGVIVSCYPL